VKWDIYPEPEELVVVRASSGGREGGMPDGSVLVLGTTGWF